MRSTLVLVVVLTGCASLQHDHSAFDTGDIAPGASASLTFAEAGVLTVHCHPHPWMKQTVRVVEGGPLAASVTVLDVMGADEDGYRYEPAELTVGVGAVVTYVNTGNFTHTATQKDKAHAA